MNAILTGWKTRIVALATFLLGLATLLDPSLLTTALGLGARGNAVVFIGLSVAIFVLRQVTSTPPGNQPK